MTKSNDYDRPDSYAEGWDVLFSNLPLQLLRLRKTVLHSDPEILEPLLVTSRQFSFTKLGIADR